MLREIFSFTLLWKIVNITIFFFFQAEDGIRDPLVTGVQTCALPIFLAPTHWSWRSLWCCNRRNSADSYRTGHARRTACLDRSGGVSGRPGGSFQASRLRGSISATFFFCYSGLASAQALAMARSRCLCGGRGSPPNASEPFPRRTGCPLRFLRWRLVLEDIGKKG